MFVAIPPWAPAWRRIEIMGWRGRAVWGWGFYDSERWLHLGWIAIHVPIFERF